MKCANCRSTVFDESRFCLFCGSEIDRSELKLQKLREIGAGPIVLAAAIFTGIQGLSSFFNETWFMALFTLFFATSLFFIWRGCQNNRSPILGLKLVICTLLLTAVGFCIIIFKSLGSLNSIEQYYNYYDFQFYLLYTKIMNAVIRILIIGLGLVTWILFFRFYRSLYMTAIRKAQEIRHAGFVSLMYLISAGVMITIVWLFLAEDIRSIISRGWNDGYISDMKPMWMYLHIQMTYGIHILLGNLSDLCSGISSLLIGLTIINIKKAWR